MQEIYEIIKSQLLSKNKKAMGIIGPAGVGKSDIIRSLAKELGRPIIEERAGYKTPGDLIGLPYAEKIKFEDIVNGEKVEKEHNVTAFLQTKWLLELQRNPNAIFVLEEMSNAGPEILGALYEILLDWRINNISIPDTVNILFTGNRSEDAIGIANDLPSTFYTRATVLHIDPLKDVKFENWKAWAIANGIHTSILSYLEANPSALLHDARESASYCTPRSWAILSQNLKDNEHLRETNPKVWESVIKRIVLTNIPDETMFAEYYINGLKLKPASHYILNPREYQRSDQLFNQISYNISHFIHSQMKQSDMKNLVLFFENITKRDSVLELPILMSILNSYNTSDKNWLHELKILDKDAHFNISNLIHLKMKDINSLKSGSF